MLERCLRPKSPGNATRPTYLPLPRSCPLRRSFVLSPFGPCHTLRRLNQPSRHISSSVTCATAFVNVFAFGFPTYGRAIASPCGCTPLTTAYALGYQRNTPLVYTRCLPYPPHHHHRCRAASLQGPTTLTGHTRVWAVRHFRGAAFFTCWPWDHCDKFFTVHVLVEPDYYSLLTIGFPLLGQARHQHPDLIP